MHHHLIDATFAPEQRLQSYKAQPPTLEREGGIYKVVVHWTRAPNLITRFLRWLAASIAG
jgi:hypothetical protein